MPSSIERKVGGVVSSFALKLVSRGVVKVWSVCVDNKFLLNSFEYIHVILCNARWPYILLNTLAQSINLFILSHIYTKYSE